MVPCVSNEMRTSKHFNWVGFGKVSPSAFGVLLASAGESGGRHRAETPEMTSGGAS